MIWWIWLLIILGVILLFIILASIYTQVPADVADVVVRGNQMKVFSSHTEYNEDGKSAYYHIPSWFFLFKLGMQVHRIPLKIISINVPNFLAFDKDRARFECNIIAYVAVTAPVEAAKRFSGDMEELKIQVSKIVQAATRDATTKKAIREIINDRESIVSAIKAPLIDSISNWGITLKNIELVEFRDPENDENEKDKDGKIKKGSTVISDISSIIEEQINSEARQKNAEQIKIAKIKEAEADELAQKREVMRDEEVMKRIQEKDEKIAEKKKLAVEKQLDVERVQQVKTQQIEKEKQLVEANQRKEIELINKDQKKLIGEGDRVQAEERAKGEAAPIREKGLAEADAKEKLQAALNKFGDSAIRALVAEKVVAMQEAVGIETAKALMNADMKVFAGGEGEGKAGFDLGKLITAVSVGNEGAGIAVANKIARPNDIGMAALAVATDNKKTKMDKKPTAPEPKATKKSA